ncbi:NAD(P)-binding protein [Schizopora paradoxa]|uniref:NAD(P)-binding protein n=1 Tax=Schizopora paradoxa TaxID=27342 RepID=A0A0H2REY1_9AGAM|nr:NAD(P)-binding protein [Schizopora paradoxa]
MSGINLSKCVLVIGATSGIGRALALAIHKLPTKPTVIVAGRRQNRLDEILNEAKGDAEGAKTLHAIQFDASAKVEDLKKFVAETVAAYPELDTVVFSAGMQHIFDFTKPEEINLDFAAQEINLNYVSIFSLTTLFMPHLLKLGRPAFLVPISSTLAMVSAGRVPGYCASKAAVHSLSMSLKNSLKDTNVKVMEIMPPLVESELHDHQGTTPALTNIWLPLAEYTKHAMDGLQRGDFNIVVPQNQALWDKFEKERVDFDPMATGAFINKKA